MDTEQAGQPDLGIGRRERDGLRAEAAHLRRQNDSLDAELATRRTLAAFGEALDMLPVRDRATDLEPVPANATMTWTTGAFSTPRRCARADPAEAACRPIDTPSMPTSIISAGTTRLRRS